LTTLQRIVCSDLLKGLLLAVREWPEDRQSAVRRALGALVAALPPTGEAFRPEGVAFRPQDFEATNLVLSGYESASRLLDALRDGIKEPGELAAKFGEKFGTVQAGAEGGVWTLQFGEGVERAGLTRALCGALVEPELSSEATAVFQALVHLAAAEGSLQVLSAGAVVASFDTSAPALSAEDTIAALFQRYSEWDIASR
jgi:hypothetical protein